MVSEHNDIRLPKGLRSISIITARLTDVLIATKALVDLYLELGVEPLYQTVDDSRLKSTTSCTISTFQSHLPTIKVGLDDIEKIMEEGYDRPSANLRARIVKAQVKITHSQAIQQAKSLAQTMESFPIEYGSLKVLCLLAEKGDKEIMDSMDSALLSANHVQVPVSDAPSMLEAVKKNDQKAVDSIVRRMLGNS
jgi:hypothetical protein